MRITKIPWDFVVFGPYLGHKMLLWVLRSKLIWLHYNSEAPVPHMADIACNKLFYCTSITMSYVALNASK